MNRPSRTRLNVERLDGRDVPAAFGVPWADPAHVTASFVPDGTQSPGSASNLNAALDSVMPRAVWRGTILKALQTWSDAARLNIGLVSDSGDPIGVSGATQGDLRFGDIRFAGLPMTPEALGQAVPPDPVLSGTLAGDVFFNTSATFTPALLYKVALHEIGHALGMDHSTSRHSIMFDQVGAVSRLSAADVRGLRAMYGTPAPDAVEPATGNARFPRATPVAVPDNFNEKVPLFAFGAVNGPHDMDTYQVVTPLDYAGQVTVRLQTAGISLAALRLSVYDAGGNRIDQVSMTAVGGGFVQVTIPNAVAGQKYYARVDPGGSAGPRGRYGIAVTFDNKLDPGGLTIDQVLRGPYDQLPANDLSDLYEHPTQALYNKDNGGDDSAGGADDLHGVTGPDASVIYHATGSLTTATDVDFYRIQAPQAAQKGGYTLVARLRAVGPDGTVPQVAVQDDNENPVPSQVLVNGAGEYTIQVTGAAPGRAYFLQVSGTQAGNYTLDAAFRRHPVQLDTFVPAGTATTTATNFKLYVATTQLFGFALTATGPAGAQVQVSITDTATGNSVFSLTAPAGSTLTGLSTFLAPGEYDVQITSVGTGSLVDYLLGGSVLPDPIGPQGGGGTLAPKYTDPQNPGIYKYPTPGGTVTSPNPFLWLLLTH